MKLNDSAVFLIRKVVDVVFCTMIYYLAISTL